MLPAAQRCERCRSTDSVRRSPSDLERPGAALRQAIPDGPLPDPLVPSPRPPRRANGQPREKYRPRAGSVQRPARPCAYPPVARAHTSVGRALSDARGSHGVPISSREAAIVDTLPRTNVACASLCAPHPHRPTHVCGSADSAHTPAFKSNGRRGPGPPSALCPGVLPIGPTRHHFRLAGPPDMT